MSKILILNGPNLNMLGQRDPKLYGRETLGEIEALCRDLGHELGFKIDFRQSNHEGVLVDWIQQEKDSVAGLVINAAAYTHTSIAIHDALELVKAPVIEVHLSDPEKRESFRHISYVAPVAAATFAGHGAQSYAKALEYLHKNI